MQSSLWSLPESDWDATFRLNVTAHYFLTVALLKLLAAAASRELPADSDAAGEGETSENLAAPRTGRDAGCGSIVITSSCASMHNCTNVDLTSYAASKAAIDHLVALLAAKFAPWYVRVNSINPGCKFPCSAALIGGVFRRARSGNGLIVER